MVNSFFTDSNRKDIQIAIRKMLAAEGSMPLESTNKKSSPSSFSSSPVGVEEFDKRKALKVKSNKFHITDNAASYIKTITIYLVQKFINESNHLLNITKNKIISPLVIQTILRQITTEGEDISSTNEFIKFSKKTILTYNKQKSDRLKTNNKTFNETTRRSKPRSKSKDALLMLPVGPIGEYIRQHNKISDDAVIYLVAIIEYFYKNVLLPSCKSLAESKNRKTISLEHLKIVIKKLSTYKTILDNINF